ncbi:RidA family protein [Providencia huaxiensis]|nr:MULTISPECIES: RidA family protein [Providencia]EIL1984254.1 RidA family protein [Providencia rettgeri]EIU9516994.1 RidA family protein [Providencia rettgeri]EJD6370550.1 RidA family protein [Providencia rettgeri]EJD6374569.1 RidA family protein [Providencia rettgeri]ELR5033550.1 RidA family protein [Providencia rettgeri]
MNQSIKYANASTLVPPKGHYSHCVSANGFVFISGQLPIDALGNAATNISFTEQTKLVLNNLQACLDTVNCTKANLVQVRIYITDMNNWNSFNQIYAEWIGNYRPARAVAGVAELHFGAALEIEATAVYA